MRWYVDGDETSSLLEILSVSRVEEGFVREKIFSWDEMECLTVCNKKKKKSMRRYYCTYRW